MVKKAVSRIKEQGSDKAYSEISAKGSSFHIEISISLSSILTPRSSLTARGKISSAKL